MSSSSRYFENPYEDYDELSHGRDVGIDEKIILQLVKQYVAEIQKGTAKTRYKLRSDLYVGEAGIAFMFWKLNRSLPFKDMFPCIEQASNYIRRAKEISGTKNNTSQTSSIAFLCGDAGIYAVSAVISNDLNRKDEALKDLQNFLKGYPTCTSNSYDADEILVGRAGFLSGAYWLNQVLPNYPIGKDLIDNICSTLLERGRSYSQAKQCHLPLMYEYHDSDYLGAAHGLSSILHMLLESPRFSQQDGVTRKNTTDTSFTYLRETIEMFLDIQDAEGNFPTRLTDSNKKLIHWCHGCSGAIYLLAKAYLVFEEEKYLEGCRKCADSIWRYGLLRKGAGICHGIAGSGYAFLVMYRLTSELKYLYRAGKFAQFLSTDCFIEQARTPDRPYSLYEGLAGTVCFLADLLEPTTAYFPFMDVFDAKFGDD